MSDWSSHHHLVEMYSTMRSTPADLYPSEARFLPGLARSHARILDTGCAAGGFALIWKHYNPDLEYLGVDLSPELLRAARHLHPEERFLQGDVARGLDLPDRHADCAAALGWLHWEPRYREALRELWRLADRTLFFDVRLDLQRDWRGSQQLAPDLITPYLVLAWPSLRTFLQAELQPGQVQAYGYWGPPASSVRDVPGPICLASFVLSREPGPSQYDLPPEFLE